MRKRFTAVRRLLVAASAAAALLPLGAGVALASNTTPVLSEPTACVSLRVELKAAEDLVVVRDLDDVDATHVLKETRDRLINEARQDLRNNNCDGFTDGRDRDRNRSCADYARDGQFNFDRNDRRYRDVLDVDDDGIACERNGDDDRDNRNWDRNRGCKDLREARDKARVQINEANREITEAQALTSADGAAITPGERLEIDREVREAQDAIKEFEDERDDANRRCDDVDDDLNVALLPIPGEPTVVTSTVPAPSSSGSNDNDGNVSSSDTPSGGVETGNGVEHAWQSPSNLFWSSLAFVSLVALASVGVAVKRSEERI